MKQLLLSLKQQDVKLEVVNHQLVYDESKVSTELKAEIKAHEPDLIRLLSRQTHKLSPMPMTASHYPASYNQVVWWYRTASQSERTFSPVYFTLKIDELSQRHYFEIVKFLVDHLTILRTQVRLTEDGLVQTIHNLPVQAAYYDLTEQSAVNFQYESIKQPDSDYPFEEIKDLIVHFRDVEQGTVLETDKPLYRTAAVKLPDGSVKVIFCLDHLISDGVSLAVLSKLFEQACAAIVDDELENLKMPGLSYVDVTEWRRRDYSPGSSAYQQDQTFWQQYWDGMDQRSPVCLPVSGEQGDKPSYLEAYGGRAYVLKVDDQLTQLLSQTASASACSRYTLLMAGFLSYIHEALGFQQPSLLTTHSGRTRPEMLDVIGFFACLLTIYADIRTGHYQDVLDQVNQQLSQMQKHLHSNHYAFKPTQRDEAILKGNKEGSVFLFSYDQWLMADDETDAVFKSEAYFADNEMKHAHLWLRGYFNQGHNYLITSFNPEKHTDQQIQDFVQGYLDFMILFCQQLIPQKVA